MAQQTQLERVLPRWERWMSRWPTVAAQALMDLGKSVCLARVPRCGVCPLAAACPSRGRRFEPARKQGPYEGSFRQRRAEALRVVLAGGQPDDGEAVASLARDGLLEV